MTKIAFDLNPQDGSRLIEVELKSLSKDFLEREQERINQHDVWLSNFPSNLRMDKQAMILGLQPFYKKME